MAQHLLVLAHMPVSAIKTKITRGGEWNRTDGLHHAFLNGIGYESWENVWGMFNQITDHDAALLRRIATISRQYGDVLMGGSFSPHVPVPVCETCGVYTSRFRNDTHDILTVVNRVGRATKGSDGALSIPCEPGDVFHDVYRGRQITEAICETGFAKAVLSLEPFGIGAVSVVGKGKPPLSPASMERMREMTRQPLDTFSKAWKFLPQTMADARAKTAVPESAPAGMVIVKGGLYNWSVQGNIQQGDNLPFAVDVQYPWEPPMRDHRQLLEVHDLFVHVHPVTNAQYKEFLDKTGWLPPLTDQNWLADWSIGSDGVRNYPAGGGKRPVVWLSRDDAKAYCQHHGLRLPHDWEWQWFAQATAPAIFRGGTTRRAAIACRPRAPLAPNPRRTMSTHTPRGGRRPALRISSATSGSGQTSSAMLTPACRPFAAAPTMLLPVCVPRAKAASTTSRFRPT